MSVNTSLGRLFDWQVKEEITVPRLPAGLPVLQQLLDGVGVGETTGLIGWAGAGKTTLAMQFAVSFARQNKLPVVYMFYDSPAESYVPRLYSLTSGLPVDRIQNAGRKLEGLTRDERQQLMQGNEEIVGYMNLLEMMPTSQSDVGRGGVPELIKKVRTGFLDKGISPALIVVDQLLPLVDRDMVRRDISMVERALHINRAVEDITSFCSEIGTSALILQQKKYLENENPYELPSTGDAQGSSSWANWLTNVLVLGKMDEHCRCLLGTAKSRFISPRSEIVQLNGKYARFEWESGKFGLKNGKFINIAEDAAADAELKNAAMDLN